RGGAEFARGALQDPPAAICHRGGSQNTRRQYPAGAAERRMIPIAVESAGPPAASQNTAETRRRPGLVENREQRLELVGSPRQDPAENVGCTAEMPASGSAADNRRG